jgi:hypothetical protein
MSFTEALLFCSVFTMLKCFFLYDTIVIGDDKNFFFNALCGLKKW